jgi:site-specific recombinase XerD
MSLYFSLHKRGGVNYSKNSEIPVRLNYYYKGQKIGFSTDVSVKQKDWNEGDSNNPVKTTDENHVSKNSTLRGLKRDVEKEIDLIRVGEKEPLTKTVKDRFSNRKLREVKEVNYEYPVVEVFRKYLKDVIENSSNQFSINHIRSYRSTSKHIFTILKNIFDDRLYFDQIDGDVMNEFISYGIRKKLSNSTIKKIIGHFRTFFNWSKEKGYHNNVSVKFYSKKIKDDLSEKDVVYLYRNEVKKLFELDEINYSNSEHKKHTTEYIVDLLKDDEKRIYTNLEFCRDLLLFECGLGTRYGDTIKLKVEHFDFIRKEFKIYMEKTNRTVRVPINEMTDKIFRKYSKNKTKDDYIFPKTINGNFYPNQKFNSHIKLIGELCELNRLIHRPLRSGKNIVGDTGKSKRLYEVISSHVGRRTFIKEGIINKIEPYVIMSMVGHRSLRVFERYFSMNDEDRKVSSSLFGFVSENPKVQTSQNIDVRKRLLEIKSLFDEGLIDEDVYKEKEKEILNLI